MKRLTILSLGAGVQSTCLALMAARGGVTPMPDAAIFADTHEPRHVYEHLDWLEKLLPFPVHRVNSGDLHKDVLNSAKTSKRVSNPPFYTLSSKGEKGILRRKCTADYKVKPIIKKVRELLGFEKGERVKDAHCEQWIGISVDEVTRMKESPQQYITHRWPLVDMRMSRYDCTTWIADNNYPAAPRSACTFCPYHNNDYWRFLKKNHTEEFEEACQFDESVREGISGTTDKLYLHPDLLPLREVDLRTDVDKGQLTFLDECDGVCML
tara:strand:- start:1332 stop:2132 length:801 start_codon:yes stop_codon:yes gene_type:complete